MCEANKDNEKFIQNWILFYWKREGTLLLRQQKVVYRDRIERIREKIKEKRRKKNENK